MQGTSKTRIRERKQSGKRLEIYNNGETSMIHTEVSLLFKSYNVIWGAVDNFAKFLKREHGDVLSFFKNQYRIQSLARKKFVSRRQFIRRTAGEEVQLNSNGETALNYFTTKLKTNTLYCLDEPENSMSPAMQMNNSE